MSARQGGLGCAIRVRSKLTPCGPHKLGTVFEWIVIQFMITILESNRRGVLWYRTESYKDTRNQATHALHAVTIAIFNSNSLFLYCREHSTAWTPDSWENCSWPLPVVPDYHQCLSLTRDPCHSLDQCCCRSSNEYPHIQSKRDCWHLITKGCMAPTLVYQRFRRYTTTSH